MSAEIILAALCGGAITLAAEAFIVWYFWRRLVGRFAQRMSERDPIWSEEIGEVCPVCKSHRSFGHRPGCKLAKDLRRYQPSGLVVAMSSVGDQPGEGDEVAEGNRRVMISIGFLTLPDSVLRTVHGCWIQGGPTAPPGERWRVLKVDEYAPPKGDVAWRADVVKAEGGPTLVGRLTAMGPVPSGVERDAVLYLDTKPTLGGRIKT